MDEHLKRLAEAGLAVEAAESALATGHHQRAQDALDDLDEHLAALRAAWPEMSTAARAVIGPAAAEVRARRDAATRRLPRRRALVALSEEPDPEQEQDPESEPAPVRAA
jgi:hypothetical protein